MSAVVYVVLRSVHAVSFEDVRLRQQSEVFESLYCTGHTWSSFYFSIDLWLDFDITINSMKTSSK